MEFTDFPGSTEDQINGFKYLHQVYTSVKPDYTGRVLVPVLWDKKNNTIVNNESSEIIRMLGSRTPANSAASKAISTHRRR